MSKSAKTKTRPQLTRAEIKAYEARRAAESRRIGVPSTPTSDAQGTTTPVRRSFALTRDEEYTIIRSDLRRLVLILAFLAVVLVVATIFLR